MKYTTLFLMLWAYISDGGPGLLVAHGITDSIKYQHIIKSISDWLSYGVFPLHGTVRYGSLLGFFPLGTVPGTWYFFSTTSAEVPSVPYRYQNVTCKLC